jgi:hypothetical protein
MKGLVFYNLYVGALFLWLTAVLVVAELAKAVTEHNVGDTKGALRTRGTCERRISVLMRATYAFAKRHL